MKKTTEKLYTERHVELQSQSLWLKVEFKLRVAEGRLTLTPRRNEDFGSDGVASIQAPIG